MRAHLVRRAGADDFPARIAAFRTEIDDPVRGADHVEIVLDHHHRMPGDDELAQGGEQLGDVVEMQAGGGFVEQEQLSLAQQAGGG